MCLWDGIAFAALLAASAILVIRQMQHKNRMDQLR